MRNRLFTLFILALPALAGCARFQARPLSPADNAAALEKRSLDQPALEQFLRKNLNRPFDFSRPQTWDFETLSLVAFYYHPSLAVARAQWQTAWGGKITAAQRPNPTISAAPGYDFTATSVGLNPWLPGVSFDLPIETMGKRGYRMDEAAHLSESARLNIATTAWQVRSNLRASLLDYAAAKQRQALLEKQQAIQEKIVSAMSERIQAGAATATEAALLQINLAKIRLDLTAARRDAADARVRVADALGLTAAALQGVELNYDFSATSVPPELLSAAARGEALKGRADILGALADYAASESELQLQIAKQYPDLHFGPYYQFNQGDHQFTLSVSAELPVLNQNQGPIAEAEARRAESAARFNAAQAKAIAEIDRAMTGYQVTRDNLATLNTLAESQQKQYAAIQAQAQAGAADNLDLFNSQIELATGELVLWDARVKVQQARGELEDALQRPIESMTHALAQGPPPVASAQSVHPTPSTQP